MQAAATRQSTTTSPLDRIAAEGGMPLVHGLARDRRGVFTADGVLPRGLHVVDGAQLAHHFGGTPTRDELLRTSASGTRYLRDAHGLDWIVGGGSLFTTAKARPNDADLLAVTDGTSITTRVTKYFNRVWGSDALAPRRHPANIYPVDASRQGFRGETMLRMFASTRDARPTGLVAFRVQDLLDAVALLGPKLR